jgi:hypothetical protein
MIAVLLDIRPTKMRIIKLLAVLITSMHLYACAFWKASNLSKFLPLSRVPTFTFCTSGNSWANRERVAGI